MPRPRSIVPRARARSYADALAPQRGIPLGLVFLSLSAFALVAFLFGKRRTIVKTLVEQAGQTIDQAKVLAFEAALKLTTRWVPLIPPLTSTENDRSPDLYQRVCEQFKVTTSPRYLAQPGATWCNIYVWDATSAMNAEIPHWYDPTTGEKTAVGRGTEMRANDMYRWLERQLQGWREGTLAQAQANAAAGRPTVIAFFNTTPGRSGHVAMMLPNGNIAQAGATNLFDAPIARGFGNYPVRYFLHA